METRTQSNFLDISSYYLYFLGLKKPNLAPNLAPDFGVFFRFLVAVQRIRRTKNRATTPLPPIYAHHREKNKGKHTSFKKK